MVKKVSQVSFPMMVDAIDFILPVDKALSETSTHLIGQVVFFLHFSPAPAIGLALLMQPSVQTENLRSFRGM